MTPSNSTLVRVALYLPTLCPKNRPNVPQQPILPEAGTVKHTWNMGFLPLLEQTTFPPSPCSLDCVGGGQGGWRSNTKKDNTTGNSGHTSTVRACVHHSSPTNPTQGAACPHYNFLMLVIISVGLALRCWRGGQEPTP